MGRSVIYTRISQDRFQKRAGVQRQADDLRALADRLGIDAEIVEENDRSATKGRRPEWDRIMADLRAGRLAVLMVWSQDRAARDMTEWESVIALCRRHGVRLITQTDGEVDLDTVGGRLSSRIRAVVATAEGEIKSDRIRAANRQRATSGKSNAEAGYGFRRIRDLDARGNIVGWRDEIDPDHALVIKQAVADVLDGGSLTSIVRDLNSRGETTARGNAWTAASIRQILINPRIAGRRTHHGEIVGDTEAGPIVDIAEWRRVVAVLQDPARRTSTSTLAVHLLTGVAVCDICGGRLNASRGQLRCQATSGGQVARAEGTIDGFVTHAVAWVLADPRSREILTASDSTITDLIAEAETLRARLDEAREMAGSGALSLASLAAVEAGTRPALEAVEARLRATTSPIAELLDLAGYPDALARFQALDLITKRRVLAALFTEVRIHKGRPGRAPFDPSTVTLVWRFPELDPVLTASLR